MSKQLIGLTGKAGCGKDTTAEILKLRYDFKSLAFADPIRSALTAMMGLSSRDFAHPYKEAVIEDIGKSPRQMMQTLGTEWGRELVNQDLWLLLAKRKIKAYHASMRAVVITDVRFENEAQFIRDNGGVVWHIQRGKAGTPHAHISEAGVAFVEGDVIIDNNSTIEQLYANVAAGLTKY